MATENQRGLPKGWAQTNVENAFDVILGQSPPSSTYNIDGVGLPFFQGKAEFGDLYPTVQKWCSEPGKVAMKGDVLISVRAPVGPTNIAPDNCAIGRGLAAIRPLAGIPSLFVLYLLRSREGAIAGKGTGTTFQAITGDKLRLFEIPLPPLPEQHRIVAKTEELFTKLDAGVKALIAIKAQLKRYRQSVLKSAFEGNLTAEWREKNKGKMEHADDVLDRIKKTNSASHRIKRLWTLKLDSDGEDMVELPDGWARAQLWQLNLDISDGNYAEKYPRSSEFVAKGVPFITSLNIKNNHVVWDKMRFVSQQKHHELQRGHLLLDDIIIVTRGEIGTAAIVTDEFVGCNINAQLVRINPGMFIYPKFLLHYLSSQQAQGEFQRLKTGSTLQQLPIRRLLQLRIPILSFDEQVEVAKEIDRLLSVVESLEKSVEQSLTQSHRLRQSILKRAFKGKLVPQDPNDEPAVKLLERIRTEKQRKQAEGRAGKGKPKQPLERGLSRRMAGSPRKR